MFNYEKYKLYYINYFINYKINLKKLKIILNKKNN